MRLVTFIGIVLSALALAGPAAAQVLRQQSGAAIPSAVPAQARGQPTPQNTKLAAEPAAMAGMLAAQNSARQRIGLPPLAWSSELAARADATASAEAAGRCTINSASRTAEVEGVAFYWAAGLNRLGGSPSVQSILPSFLVSEWSVGRADYDLARHLCRRAGPCDQYAKMVSPDARQVGCARAVCPGGSQLWICRYDDSAPPAESSPTR